MNTVKEMHIGIDLLLQKINSNVLDDFEDQEKDWILNEEVIRFIKQRIDPRSNDKKLGFEASQKRFDDLKPLITPASIPCYVRDSNSVFGYLPPDYLTLINDRTTTKNLCGSSFSTTATTSVSKSIACIPIKDDVGLYAFFKIKINGTLVFNITDYITGGLASVDSKFELFYLVQRILTQQGFVCKYGSYYGTNCGQGIVIVSDVPLTIDIAYSLSDIVTVTSTINTFTKISPLNDVTEVSNRLTETDNLYNILHSSFGNTIVSSPISTLEGDKIIVFHNQKFIPTTINISYLRKPRQINLSLNQDCDLDGWIQEEVVDNASKRLAGITQSEGYRNIINENLLKE